ncbi:DNA-binding protein [Bacillus sp. X1(2014)]|jgi:putative transcriptional regulator|nr:DNA-binding protein [Bacillus sp. X1(2014)]
MKLYVRLTEVLKERGMTQKELAELTGIRAAGISELANNQRKSINREHLEKIAAVLNITDISELIEFKKEGDPN